jgi:rubrerythrin
MKKALVVLLISIMILGLSTVAQSAPSETEKNLLSAVTGETQANTNYLAFADTADKEGHKELAKIFRAIAAAELKHADDEFAILKDLDSTAVRPTPSPASPGTTKENLQAAIDGETFEYTVMYPGFAATALSEDISNARRIFNFAMKAEEVHAGIYKDLLTNFDNFNKVKYEKIYRCPVCGNIILTTPTDCPICGVKADGLIEYKIVDSTSPSPETVKNLLAAVTGETQANANYNAFADVAEKEGHKEIAKIFRAIAAAELKHADDEFAILKDLDSTAVRPTPGPVTTGTTKQNLQTAINGETYEYTVMYPGFIAAAELENETAARRIFNLAKQAEEVHAGIYADLLKNFNKFNKTKYESIYRCPVCGNIILTDPSDCPICGVKAENLVAYEIVEKGNGGGCNIGFAILALGFLPFVVRRRK